MNDPAAAKESMKGGKARAKGLGRSLKNGTKDPLYRNSFYIILTYLTSAAFGFVFWILAAKFYPEEQVGVGTALISSMLLLVFVTRFGMDYSMVRFFPSRDRSPIFNTAMVIMTGSSVVLGALFVLSIDYISPGLSILREPGNALLYILFLGANSFVYLLNNAFIALRNAKYQFYQSLLTGARVLFLPFLAFYGTMGIISSVGLSYMAAGSILLCLLLKTGIRPRFQLDAAFLREAFGFSAGNYLVVLLMSIPPQILPIIVLNVLGASDSAYYYMAFMIASLLYMIPEAVSMSLLVEGSHGEGLRKTAEKSLYISVTLLSIAVVLVYLFGEYMMGFIGEGYAENGFELLKVMALASLLMTVNSTYFSIKRVQKDMKSLVYLGATICVLLTGLSYIFMNTYGLIGVGYAWVASHLAGSLIVFMQVLRNGWIRR